MTGPRTPEPDPAPLLPEAESEAVGLRVRELVGTVQAPPSLRERIAQDGARPGRAPARWPRPRLAAGVGAVALAAVVAVVLVLTGGASAPSVDDAAALALARPTAAAPAVVGSAGLDARVGNVAFPNYAYRWPAWKAVGARHDRIGGRGATTITYRGPRGDIGYTIVDGDPLPVPGNARKLRRGGVDLAVYRHGGATVVSWQRGGHTCVLAGRGAGVEAQLVKFATWA